MPAPKTKAAPVASAAAGKRSKVFTPRAPLSAAERLPKLYRALTDQVNDGYFDNAKQTCKKILTLDPSSASAFQTLLFLHLHTDDYAAALELVTKPPAPSPPPLEFERAYCLYRLNREREALEALVAIPNHSRRENHLEAQVRYRLGEFEAAQKIYNDLLTQSSTEYDDIRTNQAATAAQLDFVTHDYQAQLSAPAIESPASGIKAYTPTAADLESHAPVASSSAPKARTKPRHKLPKGAVAGKPVTQDPDRWLPLRQRASYATPVVKKKGGKEQTGLDNHGGKSGGGGGGNKKKGKKK
ncbi:hypothetical protein VHUM_01153 [Vanrija humicola]|uniref:Signal recognition particle subunit SRP72 n=1 Tax=Vanrija humicola TaxID=5417 RepID=A0A7D8V521_VANHU|nr:hypothetical protein VHUM_01153 [Vanrija humicola]